MPDKAVVTKKELKKSTKKEGSVKQALPSKKKVEKKSVSIRFTCPYTVMGKSNTTITHVYDGKEYEYQIEMMNRVYTLPEGLKGKDLERYKLALKSHGFIDTTRSESDAIVIDDSTKEYIYKVVHPEHTERNRINGTIGLALQDNNGRPISHEKGKLKGQQIIKQVEIENGLVTTEDKLVYEALLKAGFYGAGKIEKEKE